MQRVHKSFLVFFETVLRSRKAFFFLRAMFEAAAVVPCLHDSDVILHVFPRCFVSNVAYFQRNAFVLAVRVSDALPSSALFFCQCLESPARHRRMKYITAVSRRLRTENLRHRRNSSILNSLGGQECTRRSFMEDLDLPFVFLLRCIHIPLKNITQPNLFSS